MCFLGSLRGGTKSQPRLHQQSIRIAVQGAELLARKEEPGYPYGYTSESLPGRSRSSHLGACGRRRLCSSILLITAVCLMPVAVFHYLVHKMLVVTLRQDSKWTNDNYTHHESVQHNSPRLN
jgi:hypothetical protein